MLSEQSYECSIGPFRDPSGLPIWFLGSVEAKWKTQPPHKAFGSEVTTRNGF
jgi:hypothetical protein